MKEYAWNWFLAGFTEAGEGWNGEFPLGHPEESREEVIAKLRRHFEETWEEDASDAGENP